MMKEKLFPTFFVCKDCKELTFSSTYCAKFLLEVLPHNLNISESTIEVLRYYFNFLVRHLAHNVKIITDIADDSIWHSFEDYDEYLIGE